MKKSLPWYVVVPILAAVIGACAFIYSRQSLTPPPAAIPPPMKLSFNPHDQKQAKLREQTKRAKEEKAQSANDAKGASSKPASSGTRGTSATGPRPGSN